MKVLVLGSSGQLGRCLNYQLEKTVHNAIYMSREELDVADLNLTKNKIIEISPNVVVNATAYTAVDKAEEEDKQAYLINHIAVANIANACQELDCWLIHVSTDYVFDGTSSLPYKENDRKNPQGIYGHSKLMGEIAVQSSGCKYLIFRTAWVFSEFGDNFLKSMIRLAKTNDVLKIVNDQVGCPTNAHEIARVMVDTLRYIENFVCRSGTYNLCSNRPCSWYDFAIEIFETAQAIGLPTPQTVLPISTSEYPTKARRPAYSVLDCSKIYTDFNVDPFPMEKGLFSVMSKL